MTVRAKFHLTEITETAGTLRVLKFETQYDDGIPEDKRFQQYTPWGYIKINIDNPAALSQFEIGKSYYLDFSPVPVAPAADKG